MVCVCVVGQFVINRVLSNSFNQLYIKEALSSKGNNSYQSVIIKFAATSVIYKYDRRILRRERRIRVIQLSRYQAN